MSESRGLALMAVNCCMDIYNDYDQEEVNKYAPPSVQEAWSVGRAIAEKEKAATKEKIKDFEL